MQDKKIAPGRVETFGGNVFVKGLYTVIYTVITQNRKKSHEI